ncbi:MAG: thioredoxin family protein [Gammaproteobacteria bacterium]|jgi:hypothetical protein
MQIAKSWRALFPTVLLVASWDIHAESTLGYEPDADPFNLLESAKSEAADEGKLILLMAGGDWCVWCHYLNAFIHANAEIGSALEETFVVVKAYYGDEADNSAFFNGLPEAVGYPHFWVLDSDGNILVSQNTLPLEDGDKSYSRDAFLAFIETWRRRL